MSAMIEVKTTDLVGLALNYAVGIADGRELELPGAVRGRTGIVWCDPFVIKREGHPDFHDKTRRKWEPSTDWSQGGPLLTKYRIGFGLYPDAFFACTGTNDDAGSASGETHLVAACRAVVAAKLGDTVQVPAELLEATV